MTMMALGRFRFELDTAAYQELRRDQAFRWQGQDRLGAMPHQQYLGPGRHTLSLRGVVYPHFKGGLHQLEAMAHTARQGEPQILVDGHGYIWGRWVIKRITQTHTDLDKDGSPKKGVFQVQLEQVGS